MKRYSTYLLSIFLVVPILAAAHAPAIVTQQNLKDTTFIEDTVKSQAFYGRLTGLPHTYEFTLTAPQEMYVSILEPDIPAAKNNISGLIIKEPEAGERRVTTITTLNAGSASWERFYEGAGADYYLDGPEYEGVLEPGQYRIEVNTPENIEKYVLVVGTEEIWSLSDFPGTIRTLVEVKQFMGKSGWAVFASPLVYGPAGLILIIALIIAWFTYRHVHPRDKEESFETEK